jgi:site-specific DNA-methyltransferase (adenine-specific)
MRLELGDCLEVLKTIEDNSIDSIVTDPPYGLSFMNKKWDYDVPSVDVWKECLRVLKPGGHLLSFSGSRTYHRMAVRIEDAGFEIRDQIMWVYGSGFPKSHNIGKAVDKLQGNEVKIGKAFNVAGQNFGLNQNKELRSDHPDYIKPTYDNEWEGWGTALKPSHEPIVMARKPLSEKTNAENVLRWGTGGLNIDDSRIATDDVLGRQVSENDLGAGQYGLNDGRKTKPTNKLVGTFNDNTKGLGRWPANIIFDEEAGQVLDQQSGIKNGNGEVKIQKIKKYGGSSFGLTDGRKTLPQFNEVERPQYNDKGGASRFFYCPKASKKDRDEGCDMLEEKGYEVNFKESPKQGSIEKYGMEEALKRLKGLTSKNNHPTVKPTELMLYLIKLVTPKGGTVLEPFMGSGSTGKAAVRGGYDFIGIEKEEEYLKIAKARIENELK